LGAGEVVPVVVAAVWAGAWTVASAVGLPTALAAVASRFAACGRRQGLWWWATLICS